MLKINFDFTKQEIENIKSKIYLTELEERLLIYKLKGYSITKMALLENYSNRTINKYLLKLKKKILKVI